VNHARRHVHQEGRLGLQQRAVKRNSCCAILQQEELAQKDVPVRSDL
jgi:hypothetical protein